MSKEEFTKNGSVRKRKIIAGDGVKDDIQIVGLISDMELSAKELADHKRAHWKIENNLALIREYAYNILRIYAIEEKSEWGIQRLMDCFADHPQLVMKYLYEDIASFY